MQCLFSLGVTLVSYCWWMSTLLEETIENTLALCQSITDKCTDSRNSYDNKDYYQIDQIGRYAIINLLLFFLQI